MVDRTTGIGGSDIAGVLGVVPMEHPHYKTAYEVYEEKVNGLSRDLSKSEAVKWGNILENPIASAYEDMTGEQLFSTGTFRHQKYPFLMANPDRIIPEKRKGVEIKTAGFRMNHLWGESGSKDVPEAYYMQIAHYMLVLDYLSWDLCVLIGGQDFRVYTFERDSCIDEIILEKACKFWNENVQKRVPPPIDFSDKNIQKLIRRKYSYVSDECVDLGDEYVDIANKLAEANKNIADFSKIKKECKAAILNAMGFAGRAVLPDGRSFERFLATRKGYEVQDSNYIKFKFNGG